MNTVILTNFLRHVLFLLIIAKIITSIIAIYRSFLLYTVFTAKEILPLNSDIPPQVFYMLVDLFSMVGTISGVVTFLTSLTGFAGAIYLFKYPLINFSAGLTFLLIGPGEFTEAIGATKFARSIDITLQERLYALFDSSNDINGPWKPEYDTDFSRLDITFDDSGFENGWNKFVNGSAQNHSHIDYMQYTLKCCGLHGRTYWQVRPPESCCPDEYPGTKCVFSVAHKVRCIYHFDRFTSLLSDETSENLIFGIISLSTGFVALYLTQLVKKNPEGKYKSESSTDTDEYGY